ncbi:MAG: ABC transporter permease [Bacilli bacterium]|nr:ABC transporter permease [Bacillota bacterium]NLI51877.1 ABC transporter permease [Erysipelotrichaceae bacterium]TAH58702.1 MAG: ABC transporter permease [Bacillota bacterium]
MGKYILKRVGLVFVTAFIILSLTFILMKLLPMDRPIGLAPDQLRYYNTQVRLGYMVQVQGPLMPGQTVDVTVNDGGKLYYYNQVPVMRQYLSWLRNVITRWDWGVSSRLERNVPAIEIIARKLPVSMKLNIIALFVSVPLGFLFGIIAALQKNKLPDHIISTGVMIFISIPSFVFITFLMLFFAYKLEWLPSQWPPEGLSWQMQAKAYVIPVMALSFGTIAGFTRYTRAELTEIMSSEFLLLARTKGLTKRQTVIRHALRNSLVPIVPMIIGQFIGILSGSMILEALYGIPGIGSLFVTAITNKDYNVVMVDMALYTTIGLFAGLLVDLSYGIVDPRIRMGARK